MDTKKVSKFLSLVLRHQPDTIGIKLDAQGWVEVDTLLFALGKAGKPITRAILEDVVANNDKKRFSFSEDGTKIRANQGHSIGVDLALEPQEPPFFLYHGTATRTLGPILADGLKKMSRDHVHLSNDVETAIKVGSRHGKPVVLVVRAEDHWADGAKYYLSDNGVWLTDNVPPAYIAQMTDQA